MGWTGAGETPPTSDLLGPISDDLKIMDNSASGISSTTSYDLNLDDGYAPSPGRPQQLWIDVDSLDTGDGNETYTITVLQSNDGFSSDSDTLCAAEAAVVGNGNSKIINLTKPDLRLTITCGGTTPLFKGKAWLVPISGG
ncbi:MAG: hypothetical protein H6826_14350 [Planctomycetes bacterium]|nr:hypothetical protein [Planctomycetota bacterium]